MSRMRKFAFVACPTTTEQLKNFWPITKVLPNFLVESFLRKTPPFKVSKIRKVHSTQGKEIEGYFIACPLLPKQMLELDEEVVLDKIIAAGQMAKQFGVSILGLDGVTSRLGDRGYILAEKLKMPLTNGDTLSAWSVFEAIYRITKAKNINLKETTLAIIGATTSVGSLCSRKLSEYVGKIIISDRREGKLEILKETILHLNPGIEVVTEEDTRKAVKDADIVIITTTASVALFNIIEELKPQSIVCDICAKNNVDRTPNKRKDITIIRAGLIKLPFAATLRMDKRLPKDVIYAPLAEVMLLTFQERFVNYSLGDNINLDKMEEIADIAVQHGFEVWAPDAPVL